jgi:hypothetical protein
VAASRNDLLDQFEIIGLRHNQSSTVTIRSQIFRDLLNRSIKPLANNKRSCYRL